MLSLLQSLVPPIGAYNLGMHRTTVETNQTKTSNLDIMSRHGAHVIFRWGGLVPATESFKKLSNKAKRRC